MDDAGDGDHHAKLAEHVELGELVDALSLAGNIVNLRVQAFDVIRREYG